MQSDKLNENTARRLSIASQGLHRARPFGSGAPGVLRTIEHLGYVQIDTIAVVERAHHHVLWSRVPGYQPDHLRRLVARRALFEYWSHAAAYLPMRDYRFARARMRWYRDRHRDRAPAPALRREIVDRIHAEGPLRARDFEAPAHRTTGWWDWKPAKHALEWLFMTGELMVSGRDGFEKIYDLTERVLPDGTDVSTPDNDAMAAYLLDNALRAHGLCRAADVTYLRRSAPLRKAVSELIARRVHDGTLTRGTLRGEPFYVEPYRLTHPRPRLTSRIRILSPFDPSVILRRRTATVFKFDFQIECYVPEHKRRFGYFCLPILFRDRFIGRLDAKRHVGQSTLSVRRLHLEPGTSPALVPDLAGAIRDFAYFNGCSRVELLHAAPRAWRTTLAEHLGAQ